MAGFHWSNKLLHNKTSEKLFHVTFIVYSRAVPIWSRILGSIWSDVVVIIATLCIRHTSLILNSLLNPTVRLAIMYD